MADYRLCAAGVVRQVDGALIPEDDGNADWQRYAAWREEGNTPDPAAAPAAIVPATVTNFQGRTALRMAGIFQSVSDAIDALPDPTQKAIAQDAFRTADFERDSALLNQILVALGHDTAFRDALFIQAASIKV